MFSNQEGLCRSLSRTLDVAPGVTPKRSDMAGKSARPLKLVTFSYDDFVTQDRRLIHLFDRYGLKGTFNLNSGLAGMAGSLIRCGRTVAHVRPRLSECAEIYRGHEIAAHTLTHRSLTELSDEEVVEEVERDRLALSDAAGYEVVGMAYPNGAFDARVKSLIEANTGIRYARTVATTNDFEPQRGDWLALNGTTRNLQWDRMFALGRAFVEMAPERVQLLYVWGHAYEFDAEGTWERLEEFLKFISGRSDTLYCTNREALEIIARERRECDVITS